MTRGQVGTIHAYMLCAVAACPALISYSLVSMFSCQIDLIDKRHWPDNIYKWIGRYMNHWAIIHFLFQDPAFRQWSWICEYSCQKCGESGPVKWSSSMVAHKTPSARGWLSRIIIWLRNIWACDSMSDDGGDYPLGLNGSLSNSVSITIFTKCTSLRTGWCSSRSTAQTPTVIDLTSERGHKWDIIYRYS